MRKFTHYLIICVLLATAVGAYLTVPLLAVSWWEAMEPPVAVSLVSAGVALITGVIAVLKVPISEFLNRPRLVVRFFPFDSRDCHPTAFRNNNSGALLAAAHYFRLRVENVGWSTADDIEVTLEEVRTFRDEEFVLDTEFMPLRLYWAHWKEPRFRVALPIPPGTYRHCDLGFVIDPGAPSPPLPPTENDQLLFWFDVLLRPNTGRTSLLPGRYRIRVSASGGNASCVARTIEITWNGIWHKQIDEMLKDSLVPQKGFDTA